MSDAEPLVPGPSPKHARLRERLIALAVPGQAIPSERDLTARFGVSRATVRKAIDGLVADGVLQRVHGVGTFAVRPRVETHLHLASFTQDMRRRGLRPTTRVVSVSAEAPPASVATALQLDASDLAWRVRRVRLADGEPMAVEDGWYPVRLTPGLDAHDLSASVYALLDSVYGLRIDGAHQVLWGENADAALAATLAAPLHTPLLVFERTSTARGRPVEHVISRYRGDRYQVYMDLSADT